jgi:hypothetical protein
LSADANTHCYSYSHGDVYAYRDIHAYCHFHSYSYSQCHRYRYGNAYIHHLADNADGSSSLRHLWGNGQPVCYTDLERITRQR